MFCIQEKHANPNQFDFRRQFALFVKYWDDGNASSGRVAIIVDWSIARQQIKSFTLDMPTAAFFDVTAP